MLRASGFGDGLGIGGPRLVEAWMEGLMDGKKREKEETKDEKRLVGREGESQKEQKPRRKVSLHMPPLRFFSLFVVVFYYCGQFAFQTGRFADLFQPILPRTLDSAVEMWRWRDGRCR
jgi:hypothetical protein